MKNMLLGFLGLVVGGFLAGGVVAGLGENFGGEASMNGDLVISAINAGYTEGEAKQNYDFMELYNVTGEPLLLDGWRVEYVNSVGNVAGTIDFAGGMVLNAEYLVLGFADAPQYAEMDELYAYDFGSSAGLASTAGALRLYNGENLADEVCWGGAVCVQNFIKFGTKVEDNMTLKRCIVDGLVEACKDERWFEPAKYYPEINVEALQLAEVEEVLPQCMGLIFSEIYSYFELDYAEQFMEIYNPTDEAIILDGCAIEYKNKSYGLIGEVLPEEYLVFKNPELKLTKNPSSSNEIFLVDTDGSMAAQMVYYYGQKKGTSVAWFGEEGWKQTYDVTAGMENVWQEFRSCMVGKVINPQTGNCINFDEDEEPLPCPVGKFRNPETGRCRSYESIDNILQPCDDGYYRSAETNRCRKVEAVTTAVKPCADGYERNLETNRCRKIRENNGADYAVSGGTVAVASSWVGYGALVAVVAIGVGYVGWQFREEIKRGMMVSVRKVFRRK